MLTILIAVAYLSIGMVVARRQAVRIFKNADVLFAKNQRAHPDWSSFRNGIEYYRSWAKAKLAGVVFVWPFVAVATMAISFLAAPEMRRQQEIVETSRSFQDWTKKSQDRAATADERSMASELAKISEEKLRSLR